MSRDGGPLAAKTVSFTMLSTVFAHLFTSNDTPSAVVVKPRGCLACPTLPAWAGVWVGGKGRSTGQNLADSHCSWFSAASHAWRICWLLPACGWAPETVFLLKVFSPIVAFGETICWTPYTAMYYMNSRTPTELEALGGTLFCTY